MTHLFDADTAVERDGDGFTAIISPSWDALAGVNGGYASAVCLQALKEVLPQPDPLVVSSFFVKPVKHAPARLVTESIREGRRVATGNVSMFQDDVEVIRQTASFGTLDASRGPRFVGEKAPDLPPPEECIDPMDIGAPIPNIPIVDRVEYRATKVPGWVTGSPTNDPQSEFWMRLTEGREQDLVSLAFMVDAAAPAVLDIGQLSTTMQLTVHLRAHPAPGWLACRLKTRFVSGGFHEEDMDIFDSTGELVAQSRQLAMLLS